MSIPYPIYFNNENNLETHTIMCFIPTTYKYYAIFVSQRNYLHKKLFYCNLQKQSKILFKLYFHAIVNFSTPVTIFRNLRLISKCEKCAKNNLANYQSLVYIFRRKGVSGCSNFVEYKHFSESEV